METRFKKNLKQLLSLACGFLPVGLLTWIAQFSLQKEMVASSSAAAIFLRLARLGLSNRNVTIPTGSATGLQFNAGNSNSDYALGVNERPVQAVLAQYLKPGSVFYDIGANVGFFAIMAARLVGASGQVYAFEPEQENADCIRHNLQLNCLDNIILIQKAVASHSGSGELVLAEYAGGHALSTVGTLPERKGSITVELVSIDDLISQRKILPPTFVKIDVEGAELEVLQGMSQTLKTYKPFLLYEVDDWNEASFVSKLEAIAAFVQDFDYQSIHLKDSYPDIGWHVGHVIAIPKIPNPTDSY